MQLPDRRKLFQQRHHRREEIEAQLRRAQIEDQSSTENSSSEDEDSFEDESEEEEVSEDESEEEVVNEDESEEEVVNESEFEEEVVNEDESENEVANEDESEEEMINEDESEKEEEEIVDGEEYNSSFSEKSLANSSGSHNSSNNLSLNTIKVKIDDSLISAVHDESNETSQDNTVIANNNNVLMNKNNSDDDDDKSQTLYNSNFSMNELQNQVVEWMVTRESQKPYGGIIATDMGTTDCKVTILMHLLSKSNFPNSDNTQSEGETDLDETISSRGCTLIVCPRSSIDHWFDHLNNKKKPGSLNVWLHYGRNRDISLHELTQKDVVITTVTLVLTGFRNKVNNPLYQIKWHRIILDDIKLYNYKQQTSKALCQLSGICHWVFSGPTIIDNDDDEAIYSLIKFINYKPLNIFENWKKWIKANKTVSMHEKLGHLYYKKEIV